MKIEEIRSLAAQGESETLEFKATTGTRREAAMTLCAMLNQDGGRVLFGVTRDANPVGQQVGDTTIELISAELQRIDPTVYPEIERVQVAEDREVIAVRVDTGPAKPYRYRGTSYCRVGNTTLEMTAEACNRMLFERMHSDQRWENQPATGWTVKALDGPEIWITVDEAVRRGRLDDPGTRDVGELLRGLGLVRDGVLLRAAAVLFGDASRIEYQMPQCTLRVARFKGTDRTEFLDNRQFYGNAFTLLKAAERFLRDTVPIAGRIEADRFERVDEPLYPKVATREALANALCHRDYSIGGGSVGVAVYDDRLEITSSGSLHFGLTPETLFEAHESLPWNPLIARVFYRRGLIETWGRGTAKMAEEAAAAGLPQVEIEDAGGCVTVRFRHGRGARAFRDALTELDVMEDLTQRQREILELLGGADLPLALREIRSLLGPETNVRQLREELSKLQSRGLVALSGHGRGARWRLR